MILRELGMESTALGFAAGFTGKALTEALRQKGITADLIEVEEGMTRINVKLKAQEETEINGIGPKIEPHHFDMLLNKVKNLSEGDVLTVSGSVPKSLSGDVYERIAAALPQDVMLVADAEKNLLLPLLKYKPFLIKPNHIELAEMCNTVINNEEELLACAAKLQEMGARNVLVSMAGEGAVLLDEEGGVHRAPAAKGKLVSSVGAGDSMLAGFLAGWLKSGSYEEALMLGTACGGATAFTSGLADRERIEEVLTSLKEK
jgi:1-phosphofructokinase